MDSFYIAMFSRVDRLVWILNETATRMHVSFSFFNLSLLETAQWFINPIYIDFFCYIILTMKKIY